MIILLIDAFRMSLGDVVNCVIAEAALIWSVYTYIKHSKKLNEQQISINELQSKVLEVELTNSQKANIIVSISKDEQNVKIMNITNCGKAIARNVVIKGLDQEHFCIVRNPYRFVAEVLRPQESFAIHFTVNYGAPSAVITIFWDDDYQQNNSAEQKIIIP